MAKPTKKGRSTDGHRIGKGKMGKGKVGKDQPGRNEREKKMSFKSKPKKFVGKKSTKTFVKGKKFISSKTNIDKDEKIDASTKTTSQKRKVLVDTDEKDNSAKVAKKSDPIVAQLMTIYETLRRKNTSKEIKNKLIEEVLKMCEEKEHEIIHKHGTVRVLEMCVKYGNQEQRNKLFQVFDKHLMGLVTSKYAKFLVQKFIEYGSKDQKRKIIESFRGHVKKLIRHKGASSIVDDVYDRYADSNQREALSEEFYGPEISIFKAASGSTAEEIFKNDSRKKASVIKHMKEQLDILCQKEVVAHSIIHTALNNFFKIASDNDKMDVIALLKEKVVHILHTRDGAHVAMNCIWYSSAKDRKAIVKSFKTFVVKICKEEFGHVVLLALFDAVDDTVLIKKSIIPEVVSKLEELMVDMYGRKVLLYLLKPRSSSYFAPNIVQLLQKGDDNPHSKKDRSVRAKELCGALLPDLVEVLKKQLNDIVYNKSVAIILLAVLDVVIASTEGDSLLEDVAKLVGKPIKSSGDDEKPDDATGHPVCHECGHWIVKRIINQDKQRAENGQDLLFSTLLCDAVPKGCFADWAASNRGAFVLVSLMESNIKSVQTRVKEDLKFLKIKSSTKGLEVLEKFL